MDWQILDPQNNPVSVTEQQIRALVGQGVLKRSTLMWRDGMPDWLPAGEVRTDIFPPVSGPATGAPPAPAANPYMTAPPIPRAPAILPQGAVRAPQQVIYRQPKKGKGGLFLKLGLIVVAVLVVGGFLASKLGSGGAPRSPGDAALRDAESLMTGSATKGFGETAPERAAAEAVAQLCATLRKQAISEASGSTGRGKSGLLRKAAAGLDGDGFTTVCSVQRDTAVFLVHVPDLRKFEDDAKAAMGEIAWIAAKMGWSSLAAPRPKQIAVGIKGIANYDRVLEGYATDEEAKSTITGSSARTRLAEIFTPPEAPADKGKDKDAVTDKEKKVATPPEKEEKPAASSEGTK